MAKVLDKIATHPLQTSAWSEFRRHWGNEILETKYGLLIINRLPLGIGIGTFIKGPKPTQKMLSDLKNLAKEHNLIFIKLEPNVKKTKQLVSLMQNNAAVPGKTLFTPTTFWIDLTKSEEDLLKSFHPKTRYNIGYAQRKGVVVNKDNSDEAFEKYLELTRETTRRQGFYAHTEKYHRLMWQTLKKADIAHLFVAKHGKEILTTWIIFKWKDYIYYPYGAWSGEKQNLQPNSLMMWEAIRFGKAQKCKTFDLWGREIGKGFTRFKEGFNPEIIEFLGTWDLVTSPLYYPYRAAEFLRWRLLRLRARFSKPNF
ncbi:hypothetical protein A2801_02120 [Candidatus Woesebacteria bacterium RIFCSPHIGHO2_01_FULL_41_10]|uniref:BioF2-like acetyltransferase domain-containing protein n=1 Tax=Candidatus Woesebacteria bacterium RIFCSPHIGHO2_01_FULL_41_10 TaxID=1802500 RepID=A0A1F7YQ58_9BACT|nr:MAG: hypothetical protein A2801_02120 [Candidatus Woesebacteria bacterium RIFCSPHIGHO2_01_FULL_41_10]